jgi:hypothetical protein
MSRRRSIWFPALAAIGMACSGCGGGTPATVPAATTVRVNGLPAAGANVTLHPAGADWAGRYAHRPFGKAGPDGAVEFSTFAPGDGAPPGTYVVTVYWPHEKESGRDGDRLGGAHESPTRPNPLTVTVAAGATELAPIDLKAPRRKPHGGTGS